MAATCVRREVYRYNKIIAISIIDTDDQHRTLFVIKHQIRLAAGFRQDPVGRVSECVDL